MIFSSAQRAELAALAGRVEAAPHSARTILVVEYARAHGRSPATVWRWLREFRGRTRRVRSDAGAARREADYEQVLTVKEQTRRADPRLGREWIGSTDKAVEVALAEGRISAPVSASAVNRYARSRKVAKDSPRKIFRPKLARRVNDVHTLDASGSKMLRVVGMDGDEFVVGVRPSDGYRRNRKAEPVGLWAIGVVDDHSGVVAAEYRAAAGESYEMVLDFLRGPWCGDPTQPVRGLPLKLNADKGPFTVKADGNGLLTLLGVALLPRNPDSPNVGGKIERRWADVWTGFEVWLARTPERELSLADLNREFGVFLAERNARPHAWNRSRARADIYREGLAEIDLRLMPDAAGSLTWQQKVRKVTPYGMVQLDNAFYRVDDALAGEWVECLVQPDGCLVCQRPSTGETFDMEAVTIDVVTDWDDYDERHDTPLQTLAKRAAADEGPRLQSAWAGDAERRVVPFSPAGREVEPDTPVRRHRDARRFVNADEGLARFRAILGVEALLEHPGLLAKAQAIIERLDRQKDACEEAFLEIAADAG